MLGYVRRIGPIGPIRDPYPLRKRDTRWGVLTVATGATGATGGAYGGLLSKVLVVLDGQYISCTGI